MKKQIRVEEVGSSRYINYQPGNGTRYETYITPTFENPEIFVISIPNLNMSFQVNSACFLAWTYVFEKIGIGGRHANACDASAITALLSEVLDVPARVHTGEDGRWTDEERCINEAHSEDESLC